MSPPVCLREFVLAARWEDTASMAANDRAVEHEQERKQLIHKIAELKAEQDV